MLFHVTQISSFIFPSVLRACAAFGDLGIGAKVHGRIIKCGFDTDAVITTALLSMYGQLRCLRDARKVFDDMAIRDVVSWSSIISSYVDNGGSNEGLEMFRLLVSEGVELDSVTMLTIAEACGELGFSRLGRSVHGYVVRRKIETCEAFHNSLIEMYSKCGDLFSAERIFGNVTNRTVTLWTLMISCYNRSGWFKEALEVFVEMLESKVEPNAVIILGVLNSCAALGWLREGKSVHCFVIKTDMEFQDDCLGPALIELYAECSKLRYCQKVLHTIGERNIVSWNMLISVYTRQGLLEEALVLFVQMQTQELMPDSFSLSSSISACGHAGLLQLGCQIHGYAIKRCFLDDFVQNSLIDMYSKCGFTDLAYLIFDKIQPKGVVTWNSMICGFSQNGKSLEAICLFDQMYVNCLEMHDVAFLSAIQACSQMGHLEKGKWLHHKLITYGVGKDLHIDTALTDMYGKCGDLRTAQGVFDSMAERSLVSWSVMIAGYGLHGHIDAAISLFTQMVDLGIKPNDITFVNILSACSHSGYVEEGKFYFKLMRDFGVEPNSEHFACMADLLSRSGDLSGAYRIIKSMPFPAHASIWSTLLNGCRIHQRMDIFQSIEKDLLDMSTNDTGYYTLLSNIYAEEGNWDGFRKVRSVMKRIGLKKVPGYSTIEIDKRIYRFGAGDTSHWQIQEIYTFLEHFQNLALEPGYNVENYVPKNVTCILPKENTFMKEEILQKLP